VSVSLTRSCGILRICMKEVEQKFLEAFLEKVTDQGRICDVASGVVALYIYTAISPSLSDTVPVGGRIN